MHVHAQLLIVSNTSYSVNVVLVSVYSYTHAFPPSCEIAVCEADREKKNQLFADYCDYL